MKMWLVINFIVPWLIVCINNISKCNGYTSSLTITDTDCDYSLQYISEDDIALVEWRGQSFRTWHHQCTISFYASNFGDALTKYQICFRVKEEYISDCDIKVSYIRNYADDYGCNDNIPELWCAGKSYDSPTAKLKITAEQNTNSRLSIEVSVKADDTVKVALIIAGVVLIVVGIASTIGIICCCRKCKKHEKPNGGMVIKSQDDLRNTRFEGETLIGYPTQQTEMVRAGQGRYRPKNITVQHVLPRGAPATQVLYTSQQPAVMLQQAPTATSPTDSSNNEIPQQHPPASAPPPSYNTCTK